MVLSKKKDHCYDYLVIGAGLSGLLVTAGLKKKAYEVLLIDSSDFAGGASRQVSTPVGLTDNGLKLIPAGDAANFDEIAKYLSEILSESITYEIIDNGPISFANKELKPFIGFGSFAPSFHKPLSYYLNHKRANFLIGEKVISIGDLTNKLIAIIGESFIPRSLATELIRDDQGKISQVSVNGVKSVSALNFIYCGSPKTFSRLIAESNLPLKLRQKMAKGVYWTSICLDFFHRVSISDRHELHLLTGTTQDEIGPCVGIFHQPVVSNVDSNVNNSIDEVIQHSQWLTFIDDESTSDTETIGTILKKIKRQIKRAYPEALDQLISERISVLPFSEAELDIKLNGNCLLPGFTNLYVGSGDWTGHPNLLGHLEHTQKMMLAIDSLESKHM